MNDKQKEIDVKDYYLDFWKERSKAAESIDGLNAALLIDIASTLASIDDKLGQILDK